MPGLTPASDKLFTEDPATKAAYDSALEAARKEEKDKLYPGLEESKKAASDAEAAKAVLATEKKALEEKLAGIEKASMDAKAAAEAKAAEDAKAATEAEEAAKREKMSEEERRAADIKAVREELAETNAKLLKDKEDAEKRAADAAKQVENIADAAAKRITDAELSAYQEKAVAASKIRLTELVTGDTAEEIDASIVKVQEREKELFGEFKTAAEKAAQVEVTKGLPAPPSVVAPGGSAVDGLSRKEIAKIRDPAAYAKHRAALLDLAKKKGS